MQLTIDLPDKLAREVEPERAHLAEILELGLRQHRAVASGLRREFLAFLAHGPEAGEIVAFLPSEVTVARVRELLRRSKDSRLTSEEEAEMDDIAEMDHLITQVKAQARRHLQAA